MVESSLQRGQVTGERVHNAYRECVQAHVESFDSFIRTGIPSVVESVPPVLVDIATRQEQWEIWLSNPAIGKPSVDGDGKQRLLPRHCREMGVTYKSRLSMDFNVRDTETGAHVSMTRSFGYMPVMLQSSLCHLRGCSREELVEMKEEADEFGGIFICNGSEKVLRLLIANRRHYVLAFRRSAYKKRGSNFTEYATLFRSVRPDQSSLTCRLHYLEDGNASFALTINRAEYFIPVAVLLKGLKEVTDKEIFALLSSGAGSDGRYQDADGDDGESGGTADAHLSFVQERAYVALTTASRIGCNTQAEVFMYLGRHFRVALPRVLESQSDYEVGERLLREHCFVHLPSFDDKFNLLLQMVHKLYAVVNLQCCEDDADALTHHEILLPGHLLAKFLKERVQDWLVDVAKQVERDDTKDPDTVQMSDNYIKRISDNGSEMGRRFEYLLSTGNLSTRTGLDISQTTGFTVLAEKLNFCRYLSHFRAVHRGAYFNEIRTTDVRKLRPEAFGFLCPVHTPDGSPCGLLNHLASRCNVVSEPPPPDSRAALNTVLASHGVFPSDLQAELALVLPKYLSVLLDGRVVGYAAASRVPSIVTELRKLKASALKAATGTAGLVKKTFIPFHLEVVHIPYERGGPYPGLFLFTEPARMMRPVRQLHSGKTELVGTLEQSVMHIRCPDGGAGGSPGIVFTHTELDTSSMLSNIANLTPFSDFNQSPRNMYQCQMGKQTMGTPSTVYGHRADNKLYRLHTPQRPIARTKAYDSLCMDEYPQGTNMVVAVVAYTGYDMEDAMILNRAAVNRGLAHGSLYKTDTMDLADHKGGTFVFGAQELSPQAHKKEVEKEKSNPPSDAFGASLPRNIRTVDSTNLLPDPLVRNSDRIDHDGLPKVGAVVWPGQAFAAAMDLEKGNKPKPFPLKGEEAAVVSRVTKLPPSRKQRRTAAQGCSRANVTLRLNRNPVIGDKFASRAGQKGVLGQLWPDEDMPFVSSTGMRPDLLINPHAFPSRMTIGMLLESMASKAGALSGKYVDASAFQKCEEDADSEYAHKPVEYVAKQLESQGYARHGSEVMINGFTGEEMECEIFIGLVYYQRLRHMVKDKFQVRSQGKNNPLTKQPIKGRKAGGGIRFGEMERDSLLAHGAAFLLHDRLHYCSDYHVLDVCRTCGSVLSLLHVPGHADKMMASGATVAVGKQEEPEVTCVLCKEKGKPERVAVPYVLKYLLCELGMMHIKVTLGMSEHVP